MAKKKAPLLKYLTFPEPNNGKWYFYEKDELGNELDAFEAESEAAANELRNKKLKGKK